MRFLFRAAGDGAGLRRPRSASALTRRGPGLGLGPGRLKGLCRKATRQSHQASGIEGVAVAGEPCGLCRALGRRVQGKGPGLASRQKAWGLMLARSPTLAG